MSNFSPVRQRGSVRALLRLDLITAISLRAAHCTKRRAVRAQQHSLPHTACSSNDTRVKMRKVDSFGMIDCQLVKHDEAQKVLKECIASVKADLTSKADPVISYVAGLCSYLCGEQIWDS